MLRNFEIIGLENSKVELLLLQYSAKSILLSQILAGRTAKEKAGYRKIKKTIGQ